MRRIGQMTILMFWRMKMARKLINTKEISHEEWLTLRKKSIGGSDAGALMDMNPWSSPLTLYADKKGLSKEKETTEAMRLGTDLEEYVASRFCEKTEKKVRKDNIMWQDDEYDFITANVDREIVGENAGLECKTMNSFAGYDLENGDVPSQYYCQCQHYMMVKGYERMYLAILIFQKGIYVLTIERNEPFITELREAEVEFWTEYIEKGQMPAPSGNDMETVKEIYPAAISGEMSLENADASIRRIRELDKIIKDFKEEQEQIKADLCARLGDHAVGLGAEYACSWKNQKREGVDSRKLKKEFPEIYEKVRKVSEFRVFRTKKM